jgi:hypothetical protein
MSTPWTVIRTATEKKPKKARTPPMLPQFSEAMPPG